MSLRERLESRSFEETVLVIRGERFLVRELDRATISRLYADCYSKNGSLDKSRLECMLLCKSIFDPELMTPVYEADDWQKWDSIGRGFTGPLFSEVMRLSGLDNDDVGREVKNSDTTTS